MDTLLVKIACARQQDLNEEEQAPHLGHHNPPTRLDRQAAANDEESAAAGEYASSRQSGEVMHRVIRFHVFTDGDCPPMDEIEDLLRVGAMPRFASSWGGTHDCHSLALAAMSDIAVAVARSTKKPASTWAWCRARCKGVVHSYLLTRSTRSPASWVVDASNGAKHPVWILPADVYLDLCEATDVALVSRVPKVFAVDQ
jgi:hypothetical protein